MAPPNRFRHTMATVFYCIPCIDKFRCKKNISEKEKQEREDEYAKTGEVPRCTLCKNQHWRCKDNKCRQCCKLRECNEINCSNCQKEGIECKRVIPKTKEEFEKLKESGLTYISGQYESTKNSQLHEQIYHQFKTRETTKSIRGMFNHRAMNIPKYLNGDSQQNKEYSMKR